jgi:hypothetical protein
LIIDRAGAIVGLVGFFAAAACFSMGGEPKQLPVTGTYVHVPSGRQFPERVGEFRRERILQYDETGRHVSVGYNLEGDEWVIVATAYVHPLTQTGVTGEVHEILKAHSHARLVFEQEITLTRGARSLACQLRGFSYEEMFARRFQPVSSYLLICDDPPWRVKWRITHLPTEDRRVTDLMRKLATELTMGE